MSPLFPSDFINETLLTLSLLLPRSDQTSRTWYLSQPKHLNLDPTAIKLQHLTAEDRQISNFHYWHDRLVILKQVFDEAEPKSISQWWKDRRKPVQWYNFWFAVALIAGLTVFFGLVQSVEGAMQVWYAIYPN